MAEHTISFIDVPLKSKTPPPDRKASALKHLPSADFAHMGWNDDDRTPLLRDSVEPNKTKTKEQFVLEFYSPHLSHAGDARERPPLSTAMTKAAEKLNRVGWSPLRKTQSVLSFVDPFEDVTRRDLKRANLLHPVVGAASPKSAAPSRCPQCHSSHMVLVPVCKYCKRLDVLSQPTTAVKRFAYSVLERQPHMAATQLVEELINYLYTHEPYAKRPSTSPSKPTTSAAMRPSPISADEVNNLMQGLHHHNLLPAAPSTREALLELKTVRSKPDVGEAPRQLSHTTKSTLVHYLLHSFSQPHGEPVEWTKEQRWDHQDLCLEMLKSLGMDDVSDVMRAYNAWKHVSNLAHERTDDGRCDVPSSSSSAAAVRHALAEPTAAIESEADSVVPDVRTFELERKKANVRPMVSPDRTRQLIQRKTMRKASAYALTHMKVLVPPPPSDSPKEISLLSEHYEAEQEEKLRVVLLNAERYKTTSIDGMFSIDNTTFLVQALAPQDLMNVLLLDNQSQEMFLLGDEADRDSILQLAPMARLDAVAAWIAKNVDNHKLLIAATGAKGQLLSSDERRLLLAMDEEDCRYHLQMWKHWQHLPADHHPVPNLAFLQLHTPNKRGLRRLREEFFRIPRFWMKFIKAREMKIQPMPLTVIRPFLLGIYQAATKQHVPLYDFVEFVVQFIALEYGSQTKHRLQGFITALEQYYIKDAWVFTFCRFCGMAEDLPADCFTFYLSAIQCLQFAVPNRSQLADYYLPSDLFYPLFVKKAIMALRAIAADANIDEDKWYATLKDSRVICPRKAVLGSPIYVVGLAPFMALVLDIWLANRKLMEDEMRRLFVQFDTDHSKSLSYDEFHAFILHCHDVLLMQSIRGSFVRRAIDEKNIVKLYGKCLMQSDASEINIESFVIGGLENPLTLAMFGFSVPPTQTTAASMMATQLIMRAMRSYIKRIRATRGIIAPDVE
ncbi:Aste57867_5812 [Aphanomyces stellatus]|uniref:Aste57867_5812 protein n=1 Tax=Aphanomyces stellatus TaxID=120398 RepID=A0A485KGV9_9STRA|nr:hypothetical protein As57867_005798 [Aphanomyces stellatus]VFT82835.1 Aste57867_5812 [Aphanomyces stellatus]